MGTVSRAEEGARARECIPENAPFLSDRREDEWVILDMEAGIEHLGRGTAMGVDHMLVVVEPNRTAWRRPSGYRVSRKTLKSSGSTWCATRYSPRRTRVPQKPPRRFRHTRLRAAVDRHTANQPEPLVAFRRRKGDPFAFRDDDRQAREHEGGRVRI